MTPLNNQICILIKGEMENIEVKPRRRDIVIIASAHNPGSLANVASKYVDLLPHIPYQSLGLNFSWSIEMNEGETVPKIGLNINKGRSLEEIKQFIGSFSTRYDDSLSVL